jgi:N-methylhydantoinase B
VEVLTPGGGGYGDPLERDPELVRRDIQRGYYTAEQALELFGVSIDENGEIDGAETRQARAGALKRTA